jgi:hypothetical protein
MRQTWWLACALWSTQGAAQTVHKCVLADGATSYQSLPCAGSAREAVRWDAPPDPLPSAEQLAKLAMLREHGRAESEFLSRRAGTGVRGGDTSRTHRVPAAGRPSSCDAARATREQTLERVGLKRTYELLSRLDEQVRKACR